MPNVLIFAGAPEADWSSPDSLLLFAPPAPSPINLSPAPTSTTSSPTSTPATQNATAANTTTTALPSWRSLPLHHKPLTTGYSQPHGLPSNFLPPSHFFSLARDVHTQETTTNNNNNNNNNNDDTTTTTDSQDNLLSQQFYNHSLALHHDLASSQLPHPPSASQPPPKHTDTSFNTTTSSSFVTETTDSFEDTTTADLSTSTTPPPPLQTSHHLSDLEDIPPGPSLLALAPQTVTVNLIAGIISVSTPRAVTTRWGNELSLVEVLLGDETRAGFGVTFWLPSMPPPPAAAAKSTGKTGVTAAGGPTSPANLRRQDVVLLQNVALHVFKGKVYGQSLRKGLTRTTVLYRRKLGEGDEGGYYRPRDLERSIITGDGGGGGEGGDGEPTTVHPQLVKTRKVWEWVMRFVGGGGGEEQRTTARGIVRRGWDALPDDTQ
ncbi:hypothetical protein BDP81DRAFT_451682 [Colletotrichum phormii]|uniref:Nucleic acid-binding, OB-fold protein n=1 Tax=Colletotrichum phormii TaxID=359342 RepID=A0AAI9ZM25_9PEZI|nr:uncharacterized protein BDP81DRAFT_451682 [Colletotrichum phormii]KAK1634486.1 hypothetical protein BDP81DRAFT_451682 [Colletotrichum phormii]